MSRIGKAPVPIPDKVKVKIERNQVQVEGPKGSLDFTMPASTQAVVENGQVRVSRTGDDPRARANHGLARAMINNMVIGVSKGFERRLEIHGVGFKASVDSGRIQMSLGYSHPIVYPIPAQIKVTVEENTKVKIEGPSKQVVGLVASELRAFYPAEPYKGKGVRYAGEQIVRKEGKTVQ